MNIVGGVTAFIAGLAIGAVIGWRIDAAFTRLLDSILPSEGPWR